LSLSQPSVDGIAVRVRASVASAAPRRADTTKSKDLRTIEQSLESGDGSEGQPKCFEACIRRTSELVFRLREWTWRMKDFLRWHDNSAELPN